MSKYRVTLLVDPVVFAGYDVIGEPSDVSFIAVITPSSVGFVIVPD